MKVVIIGSGNVATVLAKKLFSHQYSIIQVFSRNEEHAKQLATLVNADYTCSIHQLYQKADLYIIALADKAVEKIAEQLQVADKIVVHTAAAISINVLQNTSNHYGVLYPIQSLTKETATDVNIPFAIAGNNEAVIKTLQKITADIKSKAEVYTDEERIKLHVAAVLCNNFVNYLYIQAYQYCQNEQLHFAMLQPLIEETAYRLRSHLPKSVLTGPAVREDEKTIQQHISLLQSYPSILQVYQTITHSIIQNKHNPL